MRYPALLILALILTLAACATPAAEPTPTPESAVEAGTPVPILVPTPLPGDTSGSSNQEPPTPQPQIEVATYQAAIGAPVEAIPVGQIVLPERTPEVVPFAQAFRRLEYTQTGGAGNVTLTITLDASGVLTRNDVQTTLPAAEVAAVIDGLDKLRVMDLSGSFDGPPSASSTYRFSLVVQTETGVRRLDANDAYTPAELQQLFFALAQLGVTPFTLPGV